MSKGVFVTNEQVRLTGSPDVARFLAQCLYWSGVDMVEQRQGWFYKCRDEWQAETWLSRYKQEKARKQLCSMGLLRERRERRNTGIRLWFWFNRSLYNTLLNNLLTVKTATEQNDSNNLEESLDVLSGCTESSDSVEISMYTEDNGTIVLNSAHAPAREGKTSTIVSDYETTDDDIDRLTEIETTESTSPVSVETDVSPLPAKLSNRPDNKHSINVDDYQACHPFIFQFVKCILVNLGTDMGTANKDSYSTGTKTFIDEGFESEMITEALRGFIEKNGQAILNWYSKQHLPFPVGPLTQTDLDDAIRISKWGRWSCDDSIEL